MTFKKFTMDAERTEEEANSIVKPDCWMLRWNPHAPDNESGYSLFTPKEFEPEEGGGPIGGLLLAAMYFIMEHGDGPAFASSLIKQANELAKTVNERSSKLNSLGKTLN